MVVEEKTLRKIKEFGLNSYEAKIWTALLSRGVSTAGEISEIANVPRSRSYDVLESLEKKGFIVMKIGKPIQYIAVPPEEVLNRVKKDLRREAEEQVKVIEEFENSQLLEQLTELHSTGIDAVDPTEITGYLKGRENIYDHLHMLFKNADNQIKMSLTEDDIENMGKNLKRSFTKVENNNVQVSISASTSPDEIKDRVGFEIRNTNLKGRFIIIDKEQVVFYITEQGTHPKYETAVWIESPVLAETFEHNFNTSWSKGEVETKIKTEVTKKKGA